MKAINMCISRFDEETRTAFLDLYTKIDESQLTADGEVIEETNVEDVVNAYNNEEDEKAHV
jgi:hypothetical protein